MAQLNISNFPNSLKDEFKAICKEQKRTMVSVIRSVARQVALETETFDKKNFRKYPPNNTYIGFNENLKFRNFPEALKNRFKSACSTRGESMKYVVVSEVEKYIRRFNNG